MEKNEKFNVLPTPKFDKDIDFYTKKKKYVHISEVVKDVIVELEQGNFIGDEIPNLKVEAGGHTYKVRAANTDTKSGKSKSQAKGLLTEFAFANSRQWWLAKRTTTRFCRIRKLWS